MLLLIVVTTAKEAALLAEDSNNQQLRLNLLLQKLLSTFTILKSSMESTWVFRWDLQIPQVVSILTNVEILVRKILITINLDLATGILYLLEMNINGLQKVVNLVKLIQSAQMEINVASASIQALRIFFK